MTGSPSIEARKSTGNQQTKLRRNAHSLGQALIEIFFVVLLFMFIGMMGYETGAVYYNVNVVSNALKQAVWAASLGARDDELNSIISAVDTGLMSSMFLDHNVSDFSVEVWVPTPGGQFDIAPTSSDAGLLPHNYNATSYRRAAYIWRAHGMNVRLGMTYRVGYVAPFFGATPVFAVSLPLAASQPILARNDEDHDGMVDHYESEIFRCYGDTYVALCHTDVGGISDKLAYDLDGDDIPDSAEAGFSMYDYDNDAFLDPYDAGAGQNLLRHPRLGGNPLGGW